MPDKGFIKTARRFGAEALVNLSKRRAWHADEDEGETPGEDAAGGGENSDSVNVDELMKELKATRHEAAGRRKQIEQLQADLEAAREEAAKKLGNWEQVAEDRKRKIEALETKAQRADAYEQMMQEQNEARISQLNERAQSIVNGMIETVNPTPAQLASYLAKNAQLLSTPTAPSLDGGAGSGAAGKRPVKLPQHYEAQLKRSGLSRDEFVASLVKAGLDPDNLP